jgi:hypothetical protein
MPLNIEASWSRPLELKLARSGAIYEGEELNEIPEEAGIYVFLREHGGSKTPLYVGRAQNLRRRIEQQLNSVKLMTGIKEAQSGKRSLIYCVPQLKRKQLAARVIRIIEDALIAHALAGDYELLQKQGTKRPNHTIRFNGNRTSEAIAPPPYPPAVAVRLPKWLADERGLI